MNKRRLSSAQLAQQLGLAAATVQMYAREGRIPFDATPGGHRRFDVDEVRTALLAGKGQGMSRAERQQVAAAFGPSPRARSTARLRGARTSAADVAAASERSEAAPTRSAGGRASERRRSAAVALLAGSPGVYLSAAR
jgi:excisionase family DNA binding protein